jgi:hypothetical protein
MALTFPMVLGIARASEVNMWFDESGEVHYADMPLADVKAPRVPQSETFRKGTKMPGRSSDRPGIIASTIAADSTSDAKPVHTEDQLNEAGARAFAERRHKMIEDCEQNNGVDCERQADIELGTYAERRQKMIDDCGQNDGIDCEREVDTELGAEAIPRRHVVHAVPRANAIR